MKMKKTRSYKAGEQLAMAIIEMINLMYQNQTALNFYKGLLSTLSPDIMRRKNDKNETTKITGAE